MTTVFLDFETRSATPITYGSSKYSKNLDQLLCMAYQIDEGPVKIWTGGGCPQDLADAVEDGAEMHAFNANFEIQIWENHCVAKLGWPTVRRDQWHCTMAQAAAAALPRSLANCGEALRVKQLKSDVGKRVMLKLCKPRKPTLHNPKTWHDDPDDFDILYEYCLDDVRAERAIDDVTPRLTEAEREVWLLDQEINLRGVPVDTDLATAALSLWESYRDLLDERMTEATDGAVCTEEKKDGSKTRATARVAQLLSWLKGEGFETETVAKEWLQETLRRDDLPHNVRRVLRIREEAARTSIAKFGKILNVVEEDGRVRNCHQYHGANTGRWAGRQIQLQNIPQGGLDYKTVQHSVRMVKDGDVEGIELCVGPLGAVLTGLLRGTICAPKGKKLIAVDYSSVEARGIAWLSGQVDLLDEFRDGKDVYREMASTIFGEPASSFGGKSKERQLGKACILGAGYGMGIKTFHATCHRWGMTWVDEDLAEHAIKTYRKKNFMIKAYWDALDTASKDAVQSPGSAFHVKSAFTQVTFQVKDRWLFCTLPSGRRLAWLDPGMSLQRMPSPPFDPGTMRPTIFFTGIGLSGKGKAKRTYGGMLAENICQAVCRDLLAHAMLELERQGYPVIFHVHDEVVCEVEDDRKWNVGDVRRIMDEGPDWAENFPIESDGFEAERYRK